MTYTSQALERHIEENIGKIWDDIHEQGYHIADGIACDVEPVFHSVELRPLKGSQFRREILDTQDM